MENILWIEDIVDKTLVTPFFYTFSVDMFKFENPHKIVVGKSKF
jgi:hypothetical protein